MISYLYLPTINSGTHHVIRYVRYLPQTGYLPLILTSDTRGELANDEANHVFRAGEMLGALKQHYRAQYLRGAAADRQASATVTPPSLLGRLLRQWAIPDLQVTWVPSALRQARTLVKTHRIQALYSSSGPESNHLVALQLKRETGLPWVADFRDGWLYDPLIAARLTNPLRNRIEQRLERSVVTAADQIAVLNPMMADDLSARYPGIAPKLAVISNGFDTSDLASLARRSTGKFTLVHTGAIELSRVGTRLDGLLRALATLKAENHAVLQDLQVIFVGRLSASEKAATEAVGLPDVIQRVGEVPHQQSLQYQVDAEVLLLITHPTQLAVTTTKVFEYLGARRPILALTPEGSEAALMIQRTQTGMIVPPVDPAAIGSALLALYRQWRESALTPPTDPMIDQYEYRFLTRQLAALLDRAVGSSAPTGA